MAFLTSLTVIYNIITFTMETFSNNQSWNISQICDRFILILAGIMTAIICSMIFLHDTYSSERISTKLAISENAKISPTELSLDIKKIEVASALLGFR